MKLVIDDDEWVSEYRVLVELSWWGEPGVVWEKPVPVPLCPLPVSLTGLEFGLVLCGERLTTNRPSYGTVAWPNYSKTLLRRLWKF
jgi:hypothetical protein